MVVDIWVFIIIATVLHRVLANLADEGTKHPTRNNGLTTTRIHVACVVRKQAVDPEDIVVKGGAEVQKV